MDLTTQWHSRISMNIISLKSNILIPNQDNRLTFKNGNKMVIETSAIKEKHELLINYIKDLDTAAVAFSGGVDSTYLLAAAVEAIGDRAVAVIGRSPTYPKREMDEALSLAHQIGARHTFIDTNEIEKTEFNKNPPTRCFACKSTLFTGIWRVAENNGCRYVLEGSNADDIGDFRPGMDAARQLKVKAPLLELGFTKDEIRQLSRKMGLPTWNKPAFACLSSRIPYGKNITIEKLSRIEQAENFLRDQGFIQLRVRDYEDLCRIEVAPEDIEKLSLRETRSSVVEALKKIGYKFVCIDLEGYRTGSMNESLTTKQKTEARQQDN